MRTGLLEQVEARKAELAAAPLDHAEAVSEALRGCTTAWVGLALFAVAEVLADAAVSAGVSRPLGLSRLVCMADVSGSMSGTPMHVAITLGILVSEVRIPCSSTRCSHFRQTLYGTTWITAPPLWTKCGVSCLRTGV
jgi:hypothetical protein